MPLILNEPQTQHVIFHNPEELTLPQKPIIKNQNFIVLPLTEKQAIPKRPVSPNRHPSYLLKNFPHRPHYYPSHSVGAQEGYCLSPVPHCLRQFTSHSSSSQLPSPKQPSRTRFPQTNTTHPSRSLVSSAALSSLPSLSTTIASSSTSTSSTSSSSSSSPPLSFRSQSTSHVRKNPQEKGSESRLEPSPSASSQATPRCVLATKKVLPVPPSLSPRVRQIFMHKIGSQQAQSCAQLPRRKKKTPALDPVVPSL